MAPRTAAALAALVLFTGLLGSAVAARPLLLGQPAAPGAPRQLNGPEPGLASRLRRLGEVLGFSTGPQLAQQAQQQQPDAPAAFAPSPFQFPNFQNGDGYYAAVSGAPRNLGEQQAVPTPAPAGGVQLTQQQTQQQPDAPAAFAPSPFQFPNFQNGDGYYAAISGAPRAAGN